MLLLSQYPERGMQAAKYLLLLLVQAIAKSLQLQQSHKINSGPSLQIFKEYQMENCILPHQSLTLLETGLSPLGKCKCTKIQFFPLEQLSLLPLVSFKIALTLC